MSSVEIIALALVAIGVIKLAVILVNPHAWFNMAKKITANTTVFRIAALALGAVVLYYLLTELTIVQIFASSAFMMALAWIGFSPYKKELMEFVNHHQDGVLKKNWLLSVIWLALSFWVVKAIFGF